MGDPKFFPRNHILVIQLVIKVQVVITYEIIFDKNQVEIVLYCIFLERVHFSSKFECFFYVVTSEVKSKPVLKN